MYAASIRHVVLVQRSYSLPTMLLGRQGKCCCRYVLHSLYCHLRLASSTSCIRFTQSLAFDAAAASNQKIAQQRNLTHKKPSTTKCCSTTVVGRAAVGSTIVIIMTVENFIICIKRKINAGPATACADRVHTYENAKCFNMPIVIQQSVQCCACQGQIAIFSRALHPLKYS